MPDLVARLSGLHATLTTRIALQESLLSLSGRLDMVLSQIEMRSSTAPATLKRKPASSTVVGRYVEGQSEEETPNEIEVEMEDNEDAASVEDVEFAGDGSDESGAFEEEEEDSDDEDEDEMNGFIDDEAEEYSEEEEEEEEESE